MPAGPPVDGPLGGGYLAGRLDALLGRATRWQLCVAFSGGRDSTVLLHAAAALRRRGGPRLRALHVDHHLQPGSASFREHCRRIAASLRVPLEVLDVEGTPPRGASVEEFAREARYRLLGDALRDGEALLVAQNADDQLETVLLQWLRGAGPAGLAGMGASQPFGRGRLLRPLLALTSAELAAHADAQGLAYVTDPSNADLRFDRNYLRARVLPVLRERWPAAARSVARGARHLAEVDGLVRAQAGRDLAAAAVDRELDLRVLRRLAPPRQRALLRLWCTTQGVRVPDEARLAEVLQAVHARPDARPVVDWGDVRLRRHADRFMLEPRPPRAGDVRAMGATGAASAAAEPQRWSWRRAPRLRLAGGGTLAVERSGGGEIDLARLPPVLEVTGRAGGERLGAGVGRRSVKKLLQECGVPVSRRSLVPLVWGDRGGGRELLAVADLAAAPGLRHDAMRSVDRGRFVWRPEG